MKDQKFTKGPWEIKHSESKTAFNIVGTIPGGKYKIARLPYEFEERYDKKINDIFKNESEANAKLISSSPKMLATLLEVKNSTNFPMMETKVQIWVQEAIDLALGE